jgi:hypothetical protein
MGYVFISYSHNDAPFVSMLTSTFRLRGIEYWRDIEQIKPGDVWDEKIHYALKDAERLLVVLSEDAMASDEVSNEWRYALTLHKPIIPVYLRTCEIPYRLNTLQYVDFRAKYQAGIEQLVMFLAEPVSSYQPQEIGTDPTPYQAALKDENWHIRWDAVDVLVKMLAGAGTLKLVEVLADIFNDKRQSVRNLLKENTNLSIFTISPFIAPAGSTITLKSSVPWKGTQILIYEKRKDFAIHSLSPFPRSSRLLEEILVSSKDQEVQYITPPDNEEGTLQLVGLEIKFIHPSLGDFLEIFYYGDLSAILSKLRRRPLKTVFPPGPKFPPDVPPEPSLPPRPTPPKKG